MPLVYVAFVRVKSLLKIGRLCKFQKANVLSGCRRCRAIYLDAEMSHSCSRQQKCSFFIHFNFVNCSKRFAMPNNLRKRGVQDRIMINIHESQELDDWSKKFDVHPSLILEAVSIVGPIVNNVREWLHNRGYIKAS